MRCRTPTGLRTMRTFPTGRTGMPGRRTRFRHRGKRRRRHGRAQSRKEREKGRALPEKVLPVRTRRRRKRRLLRAREVPAEDRMATAGNARKTDPFRREGDGSNEEVRGGRCRMKAACFACQDAGLGRRDEPSPAPPTWAAAASGKDGTTSTARVMECRGGLEAEPSPRTKDPLHRSTPKRFKSAAMPA